MSSPHTGVGGAALAPDRPDKPSAGVLARSLAPNILGLALARSGLVAGSYGSYNQTDLGVYTDGSMMATLVVMGVLLLALAFSKRQLRRRTVTLLAQLCVLAEALLLLAQAAVSLDGNHPGALFWLSVALGLFSSGAMFYWLRRAKGCSGTLAAAYVFGALIVSEVYLEVLSLLPNAASLAAAAVSSLLQVACLALAFRARPLRSLGASSGAVSYFGYTRTPVDDRRFLVSTAIGIGLLAFVVGLLRGYPDGLPIVFSEPTRLGYGVLTIAISTAIILFMQRGSRRAMTMGIWITLELLACMALIVYAAFPQELDRGALFATTVNALMVGLVWYTVIAFESHGWRDPYYYALAGWIVWLGCRGIGRIGLMAVYPLAVNDLVVNAVMGMLLLVSTQTVFSRCLHDAESQLIAEEEAEPEGQDDDEGNEVAPTAAAGMTAAASMAAGVPSAPVTAPASTPTPATAAPAAEADAPVPAGSSSPATPSQETLGADAQAAGPTAAEIRASILAAMEEDDGPASPFDAPARPSRPATQASPASRPRSAQLSRLMGLDEKDAPAASRQPALAAGVEKMGHRFMLSEREIEVLTLYALGYTQKRVAEELFISPGTAHTHIKRIYAKTGMHSRQDILDYLEAYGA